MTAQCKIGDIMSSVRDFGAKGNGTSDDTVAIQLAMDTVLPQGGVLIFESGDYLISEEVTIPKNVRNNSKIIGYGATITTNNVIAMMAKELPQNNSDAVNNIRTILAIEGLSFNGNGKATTGLQLSAIYGADLRNVHVLNCIVGIDLVFCLNAFVMNCYSTNCVGTSFLARTGVGVWAGANVRNSQSNHTKFIGCRSFATTGQECQFKILGSSGVVLDSCITEGRNPEYAVFCDAELSSVVKVFRVVNHHSENAPTGSVFRIKFVGGTCLIDQLYHQQPNVVLIDADNSNSVAKICLRRTAFLPSGVKLKGRNAGNPTWYITESGQFTIDWLDPSNWVDGIVGPVTEWP